MKAVDTSVVVAAFASWHEHHVLARKAMASRPRLVAQAAVESYSVLTRLPPPHRAQSSIVWTVVLHDDNDFVAAAQHLPDLVERRVHTLPKIA
jgi:hypothetical protein